MEFILAIANMYLGSDVAVTVKLCVVHLDSYLLDCDSHHMTVKLALDGLN